MPTEKAQKILPIMQSLCPLQILLSAKKKIAENMTACNTHQIAEVMGGEGRSLLDHP